MRTWTTRTTDFCSTPEWRYPLVKLKEQGWVSETRTKDDVEGWIRRRRTREPEEDKLRRGIELGWSEGGKRTLRPMGRSKERYRGEVVKWRRKGRGRKRRRRRRKEKKKSNLNRSR